MESTFASRMKNTSRAHNKVQQVPWPNITFKTKSTKCDICGVNSYNIVQHRRIHTGEKPYPCKFCGKGFSVSCNTTRHEKTCTGRVDMEESSVRIYQQNPGKRQHVERRQGRPKNCVLKQNITEITENVREISISSKQSVQYRSKSLLQCRYCSQRLSSKASVERHERIHTGEKPFRCDGCNRSFSQKHHLNSHSKSCRSDTVTISRKVSTSNFNDNEFRRTQNLRQEKFTNDYYGPQEKYESEDNPRVTYANTTKEELISRFCRYCGKKVKPSQLKFHEWTHTGGEKPYSCSKCGLSFTTVNYRNKHEGKCTELKGTRTSSESLENHQEPLETDSISHWVNSSHSGRKCKYDYSSIDQYVTEVESENGVRLYACNLCSHTSTYRNGIRYHVTIHTGQRPIQCDYCVKGFDRPSKLKEHLKSHKLQRTMRCIQCFFHVADSQKMKAHQLGHLGSKPLLCLTCGKWFRFIDTLQAHLVEHSSL